MIVKSRPVRKIVYDLEVFISKQLNNDQYDVFAIQFNQMLKGELKTGKGAFTDILHSWSNKNFKIVPVNWSKIYPDVFRGNFLWTVKYESKDRYIPKELFFLFTGSATESADIDTLIQ